MRHLPVAMISERTRSAGDGWDKQSKAGGALGKTQGDPVSRVQQSRLSSIELCSGMARGANIPFVLPVLPSQTPPAPSYSPGGSNSSSEYSWSSAATSVLHNSIKKQCREAFQPRLRDGRMWRKLLGCHSRGLHSRAHPQVKPIGGRNHNTFNALPERVVVNKGMGYTANHSNNSRVKQQWLLEEKVEAKLKFSKFLDEVTSNVLDPNSLQAFGKPVSVCGFVTITTSQLDNKIQEVAAWSPRVPCSMAQWQGSLLEFRMTKEERNHLVEPRKTYLETDIDAVRTDGKPHNLEIKEESLPQSEIDEKQVIPPPLQFCQGFKMSPEFHCHYPRYPYKSASLPRGINMVSELFPVFNQNQASEHRL